MDTSKIIAKIYINIKHVLMLTCILAIGLILVYLDYRPTTPLNMPGEYIVFVATGTILQKLHWHVLTQTELITYYLWFPVRRRTYDDIAQLVFLPSENGCNPGLMFVTHGCERFDWRKTTDVKFGKKHPIACYRMYVTNEQIETLISQVQKHWGPVERAYLLNYRRQ